VAKVTRLMAQQTADNGAELKVELPEETVVMGDENHIIQILINLIQNSLNALTGRPQPQIRLRAEIRGEAVALSVHDNGCGIPGEHMTRIFDPFFTTKDVGEGMGLGLSLCYRMMQGMGGRIEARSQPREFAEFTLHFQSATAFL